MLMAACGGAGGDGNSSASGDSGGGDKGTVTVGSDSFAEAQIVAEMYAQVLEANGYTVERQLDIKSREIRLPAMESGKIDIAPEYLASLLSVIDPKQTASGDPQETASMLEQPLAAKGLETLEPSNVVDTNAFVVTQDTADKYSLATDSDLAGPAPDMTLGGPTECPQRPYCIPGLKDTYGVVFGDFKALEYGATITALSGGAIDVGLLYSTDGSIAENNFVLLEDDKHLQASDNITPLVRSETLSANPDIADLLNSVSAALTVDEITELNKRANVDVEKPADLAKEFLTKHNLI
jgi:osmoprotectant transport system substrate-binding protein